MLPSNAGTQLKWSPHGLRRFRARDANRDLNVDPGGSAERVDRAKRNVGIKLQGL